DSSQKKPSPEPGVAEQHLALPDPPRSPSVVSRREGEILAPAKLFAADRGQQGRKAWDSLTGRPRRQLLASLRRLRHSRSTERLEKCCIAFFLCSLNVDYKANRMMIANSLKTPSNYADDLEEMLVRLIDKGDRNLIFLLFAISPRSDGCLSE